MGWATWKRESISDGDLGAKTKDQLLLKRIREQAGRSILQMEWSNHELLPASDWLRGGVLAPANRLRPIGSLGCPIPSHASCNCQPPEIGGDWILAST